MQATDGQVAPTDRHIGRYRLDDIVAGDAGGSVWRAFDTTLNRTVAIRLVPVTDPRVATLRAAATSAAAVVDRLVVQVLDVFDTEEALVIVSEWVDGLTLGDLTRSSMPPGRSVRITRTVADAIAAIHAAGANHGRITPSCIVISDDGEIRLRGHGVNAALWGVAPGNDPNAADVFGVGAVLMACLTNRWATGPIDGLRGTPIIGGVLASPSQLIADVPSELESITCRALAAVPQRSGFTGQAAFSDINALAGELALVEDHGISFDDAHHVPQRPRIVRRLVAISAAVVAIVLVGIVGISMITLGQPNDRAAVVPKVAAPEVKPQAAAPPAAVGSEDGQLPAAAQTVERALPIVSARAYDPFGDGADNSTQVDNAFDSNTLSAWNTNTYKTAHPDGKPGVGLVLDLGQQRHINAVELGLLGNGTDVQIRLSNERLAPTDRKIINRLPIFAGAIGAPSAISLREPRPQTARYVVVWFTSLPWKVAGYQGGISNVSIRGF